MHTTCCVHSFFFSQLFFFAGGRGGSAPQAQNFLFFGKNENAKVEFACCTCGRERGREGGREGGRVGERERERRERERWGGGRGGAGDVTEDESDATIDFVRLCAQAFQHFDSFFFTPGLLEDSALMCHH
jgi:hypothetical protein